MFWLANDFGQIVVGYQKLVIKRHFSSNLNTNTVFILVLFKDYQNITTVSATVFPKAKLHVHSKYFSAIVKKNKKNPDLFPKTKKKVARNKSINPESCSVADWFRIVCWHCN